MAIFHLIPLQKR
ncbi:hypothetical protein D043_3697A, partial [Vibrio parahaemolyticus EKP-021]